MSFEKKILVVAIAFFCVSLSWAEPPKTAAELVAEADKLVKGLTPQDAQKQLGKEKFIIIDVREKDEFEAGSLKGAINIPRGLLEFSIAAQVPDKAAKVLVYCKKGGRASLACRTLQIMGYTNVFNLLKGYEGWVAAELPTTKS